MARVYVAGPMSGLPDYNRAAFIRVEQELMAQGHIVFNPARKRLGKNATWDDYMRLGIADLMRCDTIHLLPGYEDSRGATIELELAKELGMTITFEEDE